jgi:hypothetical protein
MRKVKKWRYYCDHCRKASGTPHMMRRHEAGCTKNPNRVCGLCARAEVTQASIETLIEALGGGFTHEMEKIREVSNNCPACILAAIRQSDLIKNAQLDREESGYISPDTAWDKFDFKAEMKSFWEEMKLQEEPPVYSPIDF